MEPFTLTSPTFTDGGMIPHECTCDGINRSPGLQWGGAPLNAKSYVLIMDDPDAPHGTFTHWVRFDIPESVRRLEAGQPVGGLDAINDARQPGYYGPCPPPNDPPHGYRFTLYALDVPSIDLGQRATRREVEQAMHEHVIAQTQLMGRYQRLERSAER